MTPIAEAADRVLRNPAPVSIFDTCSLLDLFRADGQRRQPRAPAGEIEVAEALLTLTTERRGEVHLFVPELVPVEFSDHASQIAREFQTWIESHDENQGWLKQASRSVGITLPEPEPIGSHSLHFAFRQLADRISHSLHFAFRQLADRILAAATVLAREPECLERAFQRLIAKRRPSHKKEIKDSINLDQCLDLCLRLRNGGFVGPCAFISSNTNDFAESPTSSRLHGDLSPEFGSVSLDYFTSIRAAVGTLRDRGQLSFQ
jgi:hypothetical protein